MAKSKDMKISIDGEQVMYSNISRSKDGYNSARVVAKIGDNEYMSVSYEWEGDSIPDFAMNLMSFMQANKIEFSAEKQCKHCKNMESKCDCMDGPKTLPDDSKDGDSKKTKAAKKKKGENPFAKKDDKMEDEEDDKKKKGKDKEKKVKDKKKEKGDDTVAAKKACGGCGKEEHSCNCKGGFKSEKMAKKEDSDLEDE